MRLFLRFNFWRLLLTGLALTLGSCSSHVYKITLKDGREYLSVTEPEYQRKTGYYRYRTLQNKDALIRAEEVLLVEQQS